MQTKASVTLLLAVAALLACAGCNQQATPAPVTPSASAAPPIPAGQGAASANQAIGSANTPPEAKAYIREHQNQINQNQPRPPGGP